MSTDKKFNCPKCNLSFTRERNLNRHLKKNTENCRLLEQQRLKEAEQIKTEYERRINVIEEKKNNVIERLANVPGTIKEKRQVIQNLSADGKIIDFEKAVFRTEIPKSVLRNTVELMSAGDIILFRKIYIDYIEPQYRCIRVKDFGRDKYQYFDGTEWVTTTLTFIAEHFANELHKKYKFMIFEKSDRIAEIDRMYPGMDFAEQNAQEIDDITVSYAKITEHVTKLGVLDSDFINEIKRGIRGVIGKPSVEKKDEQFVYNEAAEEETPEVSDDDSDGDDTDPFDESVLIPFLKMIGYDYRRFV
jgi:transcription elongation factor Elf1